MEAEKTAFEIVCLFDVSIVAATHFVMQLASLSFDHLLHDVEVSI